MNVSLFAFCFLLIGLAAQVNCGAQNISYIEGSVAASRGRALDSTVLVNIGVEEASALYASYRTKGLSVAMRQSVWFIEPSGQYAGLGLHYATRLGRSWQLFSSLLSQAQYNFGTMAGSLSSSIQWHPGASVWLVGEAGIHVNDHRADNKARIRKLAPLVKVGGMLGLSDYVRLVGFFRSAGGQSLFFTHPSLEAGAQLQSGPVGGRASVVSDLESGVGLFSNRVALSLFYVL